MSRPIPPHGTPRSYWRGCRCIGCRQALAAHRRARYRLAAYGRLPARYADAAPVRAHIARLVTAHGVTATARAAGVAESTIRRLLADPAPARVLAHTAAKLLATRDARRTPRAVPAVGSARRVQALAVAGWSAAALARHCGLSASTIRSVRAGVDMVRPRTAAAIADLYDRLWNVHPVTPAWVVARTRAMAARARWAPSLAWDDDIIDDPTARPDYGARPPKRQHVVLENAEFLTAAGYSQQEAARRLGVEPRTIDRYRQRRAAAQHRELIAA